MTVERASGAAQGSVEALPLTPAQRGCGSPRTFRPDYSVNVAPVPGHSLSRVRSTTSCSAIARWQQAGCCSRRTSVWSTWRTGRRARVVDPDLPITVDIIDFAARTIPRPPRSSGCVRSTGGPRHPQ